MAFEAEQSHGDVACTLPHHWQPEGRHSHGSGRSDHKRGQAIRVTQPGGIRCRDLENVVIESGVHGMAPSRDQARAGEAATASR